MPYRNEEPTIEVIFFPNSIRSDLNKEAFLEKVELYLSSYSSEAIFRVRILKPNDSLLPGEDLINLPIQKTLKGNQNITIDLSNYFIKMPDNGLFVGIELIMNDSNITSLKNNEGYTTFLHSPYLRYRTVREDYHFYQFTQGSWKKVKKRYTISPLDNSNKFYKPAISLTINFEK